MDIKIAESDREISDCYPVMRELRPHIEADKFLSGVRRLEESGYHPDANEFEFMEYLRVDREARNSYEI